MKDARPGRSRHLVTLGASFLLGLLFFEKTLLVAPLVFLFTVCLLVEGGLVRSIVEAELRAACRSGGVARSNHGLDQACHLLRL